MTAVPDRSDAELAGAAAAGDRVALGEIYDRYADHVFDLCTSVLRNRTEAADATQETFLLAAQQLAQLREPAKLRAWLFAIARHEALRLVRGKRRVQPTEEVGELPEPAGDPSRPAEVAELRQLVWQAAAGLDPRDRVVLDLHLRRGLEGRELADTLGVSENHAGVLLHRVRTRFERALGAWLVARQGSRDCRQLQQLLADWDGRFTPLVRKRVARHVDGCGICAAVKSRLASPTALLARVPLVPAPLALRERVLDNIELTGGAAPLPRGWREGFPPAMYASPRRHRRIAAAAAVLLVIGGLGWYGGVQWHDRGGSSGAGQPVAAETGTPDPAPPARSTRQAASAAPADATPSLAASDPTGGSGRPSDPARRPLPSPTRGPSVPFPPAGVGEVTAEPPDIQTEAGVCHHAPDLEATILVEVTEHNVLSFVYLHWSVGEAEGATEHSMPRVGNSDVRSAEVGPFPEGTIPPGGDQAIDLRIQVVDTYGQSDFYQLPDRTLTLWDCAPR